jgi:hypothetical protein
MGAAWPINLAYAEFVIRRARRQPAVVAVGGEPA